MFKVDYSDKQAWLFEGELCFDNQDLKTVLEDNIERYKTGEKAPGKIIRGTFTGVTGITDNEDFFARGIFTDKNGRQYSVKEAGQVEDEIDMSNFEWWDAANL